LADPITSLPKGKLNSKKIAEKFEEMCSVPEMALLQALSARGQSGVTAASDKGARQRTGETRESLAIRDAGRHCSR
jgi:hypothetical protein